MSNQNKSMRFKTNINCGGCVAKVTPFLNETHGIEHWEVDTSGRDKILSVKSGTVSEKEVIQTVKKAGFNIETLKSE